MMNKAFARLREAARKDRGEAFKMLSEQEVKIIALVAHGRTNREIAGELFLSEKTVRNYVSSILGKLGLSHRAQAAAYAVEHGLPGVSQSRVAVHGRRATLSPANDGMRGRRRTMHGAEHRLGKPVSPS